MRRVVKIGELEGRPGWATAPVWYEGQDNPEYVYEKDLQVRMLQQKLQQAGLTKEQMKLVEEYGEACDEAGWDRRDRNQAEIDAGSDW